MTNGESSDTTKVAAFGHVMAQGCNFPHGYSFDSVPDDALVWLTPLPDDSDAKCGLFFPIEQDANMDDVVFVRVRSVEGPTPVEGIAIIDSDVLVSLVPLRDLLEIPDDLSLLEDDGGNADDSLPSGHPEFEGFPFEPLLHDFDSKGFELAEAWLNGDFMVDETKAYLLRGLSVLPLQLSDNFVETWQVLEEGVFDAQTVKSIGAMCIALAKLRIENE